MISINPESPKPWFLIEIDGPEDIRNLSVARPIRFETQAFDQAGAYFLAGTYIRKLAESRQVPVYTMRALIKPLP